MDLEGNKSIGNSANPQGSLVQNLCSPEMFDSDSENEAIVRNIGAAASPAVLPNIIPQELSCADLIARSDNYLLARINRFLSGVPPPPRLTICRSDCNDFLSMIYQDCSLFPATCPTSEKKASLDQATSECLGARPHENTIENPLVQRTKNAPRNLTSAFDACDAFDKHRDNDLIRNPTDACDIVKMKTDASLCTIAGTLTIDYKSMNKSSTADSKSVQDKLQVGPISSSGSAERDQCKNSHSPSLLMYHTVGEEDAKKLAWPEAYHHKFHGIHYNRSKAVEEYENLIMKVCERYIGAETQSTCNVWFSKHTPGSARKRSLLAKRETGQSPGKRLSHLARRRRTFSSANLQGLVGLADKKQLVLNVRKIIGRKGKSPRGKSPRGSAKKRAVRRLALDGPSPRKAKLETSKRALFQSPPSERAGPSKATNGPALNPQMIKRALFPTPNKREEGEPADSLEETRKRKREDDGVEEQRSKWAKSLSFDCTHEFANEPNKSWEREKNSSGHVFLKMDATVNRNRSEMSDTHRKKLLWAVAEALRGKGIGMAHPRFKQYASNLARTVKKFMPDLENRNIPRKPGSTSDRMLKLAKHHVLFILDEKAAN